jgi:glutamyl-tRNA synthetase
VSPVRASTGRLALSPTGHLHLGNLFAFTLAACRVAGGNLILRNEDLDETRVRTGMGRTQQEDLRWAGIVWNAGPDLNPGEPLYQQSLRKERYAEILKLLANTDAVYPCSCSRRDIDQVLSAPHGLPVDAIYPGTCAHRRSTDSNAPALDAGDHAWRARASGVWAWDDACAGPQRWELTPAHDFVVRRRDGLFAYQLAVVVDDHDSGVSEVVRGRDLLDSTPRQLALHAALGWTPPTYAHVPLLVDGGGRLSKRDQSCGRHRLAETGWTPELMRGGFACLLGASGLRPMSMSDLADALPGLDLSPDAVEVPAEWWHGPEKYAAWVADHARNH